MFTHCLCTYSVTFVDPSEIIQAGEITPYINKTPQSTSMEKSCEKHEMK